MNKNPLLLPASIIIAGIIIAGAVMYTPGPRKTDTVVAPTVKPIDYVELSGTLGLDTAKFKTCVDTHQFKDEILKDQTDGTTAGVSGTPTTFINGTKIEGAQPYSAYKSAIDDAISKNQKDKIEVIIYGDYQCPFCGQAYRTAEKQLRKEYVDTGKANIIFRNYPLTNIHPAAMPASEAAECARVQGKFWQYHDALFDNQDRLPIP